MKNKKILALVMGVVGTFIGISGCASSGGGESTASGETTILEGTWVSNCQSEFLGVAYSITTLKYTGNSTSLEAKTYSDDKCTQTSSGFDFRSDGTFTVEDGDILDGKKLTKITQTFTVKYSEDLPAIFYPIGSTHTETHQVYLDGKKMFETDDSLDASNNMEYIPPTKIEDNKYSVKQ